MGKINFILFMLINLHCISQESPNHFSSQTSPRKISFGLNYGINGSLNNKMNISPSSSNAFLINSRYMYKPFFGFFIKGGYDSFSSKLDELSKSKFMQLSIEATYDLGGLYYSASSKELDKYFKKNKFQLFVHGGPGVASMWNNDFNSLNATDPYFKNHDDIILLILGINPECKINSRLSINLDFSVTFNFRQDRTFNYSIMNSSKNASMYSIGLGLNYFISKLNE